MAQGRAACSHNNGLSLSAPVVHDLTSDLLFTEKRQIALLKK